MEQPILENLWWVIPRELAGVRRPTAEELPDLQAAGIGAIVSLMDDPGNLDLYKQVGLPHLWLPIKGGTSPTSDQIETFWKFITQQRGWGQGVAVHCTSGRRRTGTVLASYLIKAGKSYQEALQTILDANPEVELRDAQKTFLKELASNYLLRLRE